jgi:hypothetical protein
MKHFSREIGASATASLGDIAKSSGSGAFVVNGTTNTVVTGTSCTITTKGNPVMILSMRNPSGGVDAEVRVENTVDTGGGTSGQIALERDASPIYRFQLKLNSYSIVVPTELFLPANVISYMDIVSAGTYTYQMTAKGIRADDDVYITNMVLVAYELGVGF